MLSRKREVDSVQADGSCRSFSNVFHDFFSSSFNRAAKVLSFSRGLYKWRKHVAKLTWSYISRCFKRSRESMSFFWSSWEQAIPSGLKSLCLTCCLLWFVIEKNFTHDSDDTVTCIIVNLFRDLHLGLESFLNLIRYNLHLVWKRMLLHVGRQKHVLKWLIQIFLLQLEI